jgi:WD40 repeat protein
MLCVMTAGGKEDLLTTPAAPRSLAGPTHTSQPLPRVDLGAAADESHPPPLPTQFRDPQRYHFLGEHGRGGIGRVSRAHDRELGRDVAIKELLSRTSANEVRFLREVLITARLEHPGIVPVHEAGRWGDGTPFYAMKLVAGRPLRDLIVERTTVEDRLGLLHHVIAVADALAYAHGRSIIHRDLKPANVIVGDFGETIVIDWGLAKDLKTAEVAGSEVGPFCTEPDDELSSAGSVMGTRAYMPPEQERGEPVDQRADVYAIGMMLWELCSLRKAPAPHLRNGMLRSAGIDADLVTIISKALEPDPERRYRDAGALAADLKAFKAGARIAAREYSLLAMLAHWTRRHRALAISVAGALAIAVTGTLLYVRNIAAERDRADASDAVSRRARASAESSLDELTLKHAELLLTKDPSAAVDALASYHGTDLDRADRLRAEATGRGVAFLRAVPHTDNVYWTQGTPDGTILSLSIDGTLARTSRDGKSMVLSRSVAKAGDWAYSSSRHLLAYVCSPGLCLFDVLHATPVPMAPQFQGVHVTGAGFSQDGSLLAVTRAGAELEVLDITDPARPSVRFVKPIPGGRGVVFLGDDVVGLGSEAGIQFVRITGDGELERFALADVVAWDASASEHDLALATSTGQAVVLQSFPVRVTGRAELCHGPVVSVQLIPGRHSAAYACGDGAVGIWNLQQGTVTQRAQLEGHADLITASPTGDYVVAAGGNGTVMVLDLQTDLVASYRGHGYRLTSITPPIPGYPFVISGDVHGAIRAWPLPSRLARVAATSSSRFNTAMFDDDSTTVTATTWAAALTVFTPSTGARTVEPHLPENIFLERSGNGRSFATRGMHDSVEVWSAAPIARTHVIATGHGSVSELHFIDDTDDFITSGNDGRLVRWTPLGEPTLIARTDQPIDKFAWVPTAHAIVFSTVDGALWRTGAGGEAIVLRDGGSRVNRLVGVPGRQAVYAGYESGTVIAIDTRSWQQTSLFHGTGAVREIAATRDGKVVTVVTNDETIHVGTRQPANPEQLTWTEFASRARHISLAPDGLVLASYTDGTIWLYSPARKHWLCLPTGTLDLGRTVVTADGKAAVVLDSGGRLIWVDLEAARKQIALTS